MLCNCLVCSRIMDCDSSQMCDICEIMREAKVVTKTSPMRKSQVKTDHPMPSTDHQIVTILKRLHTSMCGPERTCRWYYHDAKQVYYCDHVAIAARDVADQYWRMFNA